VIRRQERLRALGELASGHRPRLQQCARMIVGFAELILADPQALEQPEEAGRRSG